MERALRTNAAIENILKKYADTVYRIAFVRVKNVSDAEDITQEVFVRFIKRAPVFESEEHEKAWFIRVAINCSKSLLLSPWRTRRSDTERDTPVFDTEKSEVWYAVASLPEQMRVVIHLFYYENMSVSEISAATGKSVSAVKTALHRSRQKLKEILTEEEF
ncbi:MAG: sigma-70 family RNA polymerase sigma factor [Clostridia bacterium]|nr:sigma-70 family RNA polymerase sigma factor [Clostridia bacterium]